MEDTKIIELYLERSEDAIRETAEKYGSYIKTIVYGILRSTEDTEEIVSDTYLGAWNSIPPAMPHSLKHYLSRIARNLSLGRLDYITAAKRKSDVLQQLDELDECIPDSCSSVERNSDSRLIGTVINSFLDTLESEDCSVFLARYYYSMTLSEIARKHGLSERRVRYMLHCMRRKLKAHLSKEDIDI